MSFGTAKLNQAGNTALGGNLGCTVNSLVGGEAVLAFLKCEGADPTFGLSGGTGSFTALTEQAYASSGGWVQMFYKLTEASSGNVAYTASFGGNREYRYVGIFASSPDSGETISLDDEQTAAGTSGQPNSGNITTTGSDEFCAAGHGDFAADNPATFTINAVAATGSQENNAVAASSWYRLVTTGGFTGAAAIGSGIASDWACAVAALKSVASATAVRDIIGGGIIPFAR